MTRALQKKYYDNLRKQKERYWQPCEAEIKKLKLDIEAACEILRLDDSNRAAFIDRIEPDAVGYPRISRFLDEASNAHVARLRAILRMPIGVRYDSHGPLLILWHYRGIRMERDQSSNRDGESHHVGDAHLLTESRGPQVGRSELARWLRTLKLVRDYDLTFTGFRIQGPGPRELDKRAQVLLLLLLGYFDRSQVAIPDRDELVREIEALGPRMIARSPDDRRAHDILWAVRRYEDAGDLSDLRKILPPLCASNGMRIGDLGQLPIGDLGQFRATLSEPEPVRLPEFKSVDPVPWLLK